MCRLFIFYLFIYSFSTFAQDAQKYEYFEKKLSLYLSDNKDALLKIATKLEKHSEGAPIYTYEFFCSIPPNTKDEGKSLFVKNYLALIPGTGAFPCERGVDAYSKYFSLNNDSLYWISLAAKDKLFFETFEKYNKTCELKNNYPETVSFLRSRGDGDLATEIDLKWKNC